MTEDLYQSLSGAARRDGFCKQILKAIWSSAYPAYILDSNGAFLYVNTAFVHYTEKSRDKWLSLNIHNIRHTFEPSIFEQVMEQKNTITIFQNIVTASKKNYNQITTGTPLFDKDGAVSHILVITFPLSQKAESGIQKSKPTHSTFEFPAPPIAQNVAMRKVIRLARRAADSDSACLIVGETGVGKGVPAQYIHQCSNRRDLPLQAINCAALPDTLIESELFGYEPGAFTGASKSGKRGVIEAANGGTLFLDEINSLPLAAQSKLLRVLETHRVRRVGAEKEIPADFRLITTSNVSLEKMCRDGLFRMDLFYRINLISLSIPPLRQRREDIIPLTNHFMEEICRENKQQKVLSANSYRFLMEYSWPGNVRELRNFIERALLLSDQDSIVVELADYLPEAQSDPIRSIDSAPGLYTEEFSLSSYLEGLEKSLLTRLAAQFKNTYELADFLKINQSTVVRKLKKYRISLDDSRRR